MRLGGVIYAAVDTPEAWVAAVRAKGYRASFSPVKVGTDNITVASYRRAAENADIVIAEVGAWSNPLDEDPAKHQAAMDKCVASLQLADALGARCCVNIAGARGAQWDGPHPKNLTSETFDLIVNTVQEIIDSVRPTKSKYALETMPWIFPNSVTSYANLINAIDREAFGVHFDPVNLVNSPERYFYNEELIRDFVKELHPKLCVVHIKDILLQTKLTLHLDEVPPGKGGLKLNVLLQELSNLDKDLPVMLEHLPDEAAYDAASAHMRMIAAQEGVSL